eukprot:3941497-Rhodomonas_salina.1
MAPGGPSLETQVQMYREMSRYNAATSGSTSTTTNSVSSTPPRKLCEERDNRSNEKARLRGKWGQARMAGMPTFSFSPYSAASRFQTFKNAFGGLFIGVFHFALLETAFQAVSATPMLKAGECANENKANIGSREARGWVAEGSESTPATIMAAHFSLLSLQQLAAVVVVCETLNTLSHLGVRFANQRSYTEAVAARDSLSRHRRDRQRGRQKDIQIQRQTDRQKKRQTATDRDKAKAGDRYRPTDKDRH